MSLSRRPRLDSATARRLAEIRRRARGLACPDRETAVLPRETMRDLVDRIDAEARS